MVRTLEEIKEENRKYAAENCKHEMECQICFTKLGYFEIDCSCSWPNFICGKCKEGKK